MAKASRWKVISQMMKAAFFICLLFISMQVGGEYVKYKQEVPYGTVWEFVTHQEKETYDPSKEGLSQGFLDKVEGYNNIVRTIWFALFFYAMFEIFSMMDSREKHWIAHVLKAFNKIKEDSEDETDNQGGGELRDSEEDSQGMAVHDVQGSNQEPGSNPIHADKEVQD